MRLGEQGGKWVAERFKKRSNLRNEKYSERVAKSTLRYAITLIATVVRRGSSDVLLATTDYSRRFLVLEANLLEALWLNIVRKSV